MSFPVPAGGPCVVHTLPHELHPCQPPAYDSPVQPSDGYPPWVRDQQLRQAPDGLPHAAHVAPSEAAELAEFVNQPAVRAYHGPAPYWHAHIAYARRAALALAFGDLFNAQRAASISTYALTLYRRAGGSLAPGVADPYIPTT